MHHLLAEEDMHDLDMLSWIYTDKGGYKLSKKEYLRKTSDSYLNIPLDVLMPYNISDTDVTFQIYNKFEKLLAEENLTDLMYKHQMPLQRKLIRTNLEGTLVDKKYLLLLRDLYSDRIKEKLDIIKGKLKRYYTSFDVVNCVDDANLLKKQYKKEPPIDVNHKVININSDDDVRDLFFNKCGYTSVKTTESGELSVDKEVLKEFAKRNSIAQDLLDYRKLEKTMSTYIDGILS